MTTGGKYEHTLTNPPYKPDPKCDRCKVYYIKDNKHNKTKHEKQSDKMNEIDNKMIDIYGPWAKAFGKMWYYSIKNKND
jgi:hypothetical protein